MAQCNHFQQFSSYYLLGVILLVAGLCFLQLYIKRQLYRNITKDIPTIFGIPFLGIAYRLVPIKKFMYQIGAYFDQLDTLTYCAWLGTQPVIITINPEIIKTVTSSSVFYNKADSLYTPIDNAIPDGIITSKVLKWKHNRKLINLFFGHNTLVGFIPTFNRGSKHAIRRFTHLTDCGEWNLFAIIKRATLETAIATTMGVEIMKNSSDHENLVDAFNMLMQKIALDAMYSTLGLGFMARTSSYYKTLRYLRDFIRNLIDIKSSVKDQSEISSNTARHESFLNLALNHREQGLFNTEDIIVESVGLIGASFETIATALYSAVVMLAMHAEVQEKLFEEVCTLFPHKTDMLVEYSHLKQVPYLDRVVAETLRLMPSIPIVGRQTRNETNLTENIVLPKHMQVIIPIFNLHRNKKLWGPHANLFNPDNFLPENIAQRHPFAYMPFSKGARNCIGWRYAEIAVKVTLLALVRNFKFSTTFKYEDLVFINHISLWYHEEPKLSLECRP